MAPTTKARAFKSNGTTPSDTSMTDYTDRANGRKAAADDNDGAMVRRLPPNSPFPAPYAEGANEKEGI